MTQAPSHPEWQSLQEFVERRVLPVSNLLDHSSSLMKEVVTELMSLNLLSKCNEILLPSNNELELLFAGSAALGFTLGQHFAAVERLSDAKEWQHTNATAWREISTGKKLCGLATTHLASPGKPLLTGSRTEDGFKVTGEAPWCCGYKLFDYVVIGFETDEEVIFVTTKFPKENGPNGMTAIPHRLSCYNATTSVKIEFLDCVVLLNDIVSTRKKTAVPQMRTTRFIAPETGIGISAMRLARNHIEGSTHPKVHSLLLALERLELLYTKIDSLREQSPRDPQISVLSSNFNRDAVRLLSLTVGARSLNPETFVPRLQLETLLFDAVIQAPESIVSKIAGIAHENLD